MERREATLAGDWRDRWLKRIATAAKIAKYVQKTLMVRSHDGGGDGGGGDWSDDNSSSSS